MADIVSDTQSPAVDKPEMKDETKESSDVPNEDDSHNKEISETPVQEPESQEPEIQEPQKQPEPTINDRIDELDKQVQSYERDFAVVGLIEPHPPQMDEIYAQITKLKSALASIPNTTEIVTEVKTLIAKRRTEEKMHHLLGKRNETRSKHTFIPESPPKSQNLGSSFSNLLNLPSLGPTESQQLEKIQGRSPTEQPPVLNTLRLTP